MQRSSFILGLALLVVASTLAITITLRKPGEDVVSVTGENSSRYLSDRRGARRGAASYPASSPKSQSRVASEGRLAEHFSVRVPGNHPRRTHLAQRAQEVENEANSQLEKLTERLELTGEQQRRLFPILARSSEKYDPVMTISGRSAGAPPLLGTAGNRELNNVLDQPQRDQLVEDAITDQILWQEIIDKLRRRLDAQTPRVPEAESEDPPPAPQAPRRRGNLLDAVNPEP